MSNTNREIKGQLRLFKEELCKEFSQTENIVHITEKLCLFIDHIILSLFTKNKLNKNRNFSLLAMGSYGRRELQLYSDIDLLILHQPTLIQSELQQVQGFIQDCWDVGLNVGHQITTVELCAELASQDLSVMSNILDVYPLCGSRDLMDELRYQTHKLHMWSSPEFYFAKLQEQYKRHKKYGETAYNLEPNVKFGSGGLRDVQILLSIGKRHFNIKKLADGIAYGFITNKEYDVLMYCQHFLWQVRFALHMLAEKPEERLSFDYQIKLAQLFHYKDKVHSLAIEQFMKDYFKVIKRIRELNMMLLQWFDETIVHHEKQKIVRLDTEFQLSNNYIEVRHIHVFSHNPEAILRLFLWIAQRPDIEGVRASTIRLLKHSLYLMNTRFKKSSSVTQIMIQILKKGQDTYRALQSMNEYGVLAHYLDCFAAVTGQMQYDLFHVYTVDQHTLYVIRNVSRFKQLEFANQFPLCAKLMPDLEKPEILYLAALFHDIGKGAGGDHSEIGADEAKEFARIHQLDKESSELLVWLVRHHLLMSQTAQRQDIYDPKIISHFCQLLPQAHYLDYLYLLTVADICATNPNLWNAWKDSLLKELYQATKHRLYKEQELMDEMSLIATKKHYALDLLILDGVDPEKAQKLWMHFRNKYFLHESPEVIARHTKAILSSSEFPLVLISPHHSQGGTEVFIYMPHRDERFTITTTVLSNYQVTIQEAAISSCDNQFDLDTYVVLDETNQGLLNKEKSSSLQKVLSYHLGNKSGLPALSQKRIPRLLSHFKVKTQVTYSEDMLNQHSRLFLISNDRPGLLAMVGRVFQANFIHLHNAKISTAGESAEDMFYITNAKGQILNVEEQEVLRQQIGQVLR